VKRPLPAVDTCLLGGDAGASRRLEADSLECMSLDGREKLGIMQQPTPNPALERLDALVGEWNIEVSLPLDPPTIVRGRTSFEWLEGGFFLVQRWDVAHLDFPGAIAIIGCDASTETKTQTNT
jgi:hypothetical protein